MVPASLFTLLHQLTMWISSLDDVVVGRESGSRKKRRWDTTLTVRSAVGVVGTGTVVDC